jgi:hypothetical protein
MRLVALSPIQAGPSQHKIPAGSFSAENADEYPNFRRWVFCGGIPRPLRLVALRVPRRQWRALVFIFGLVAAGVGFALAVAGATRFGLSAPRAVLVALLFGGLALDYLILFSALEADSPTLAMIELVRRHGKASDRLLEFALTKCCATSSPRSKAADCMRRRAGHAWHRWSCSTIG